MTVLAQPALTLAGAQALLGINIIMPEQITTSLGITWSSEQFKSLQTFPELWSEELVSRCRETHIFVPGADLSIDDLRKRWPDVVCLSPREWMYERIQDVSPNTLKVRWYAVRKSILEGSLDKTLWDAYLLMDASEEMLYSCQLIYALLAAKLCLNQTLFPKGHRLRCKEFFGMPPQVTRNFGNALISQTETGEIYLSHYFKDLTWYDVATTTQLRVKPKGAEGT